MNALTEGTTELTWRDVMLEAVEQHQDMEQAKGAGSSVSDHILKLAKQCNGVGTSPSAKGAFKGESTGFLGACFTQENWIKSMDAGVSRVDAVPRCWTQAKANIKACMVLGISLNSHETESSLRKELNKLRKITKETPTESELDVLLSSFRGLYEALPSDQRDKLSDVLVDLHTEYANILNKVLPDTPTAPAEDDEAPAEDVQVA